MRALRLTAILSAALAASPAMAESVSFEDNKLNFKSCDGAAVTARWREHLFSLAEPGKSLGDAHTSFKHLGWDGSCNSASWDATTARFMITGASGAKASKVLRYVAPDGSKWAGMRAGDSFFVSRIAGAEDSADDARVQKTADWLSRTSREFTPGATLAELLKATKTE